VFYPEFLVKNTKTELHIAEPVLQHLLLTALSS